LPLGGIKSCLKRRILRWRRKELNVFTYLLTYLLWRVSKQRLFIPDPLFIFR